MTAVVFFHLPHASPGWATNAASAVSYVRWHKTIGTLVNLVPSTVLHLALVSLVGNCLHVHRVITKGWANSNLGQIERLHHLGVRYWGIGTKHQSASR